jgi:hypothetical protein
MVSVRAAEAGMIIFRKYPVCEDTGGSPIVQLVDLSSIFSGLEASEFVEIPSKLSELVMEFCATRLMWSLGATSPL